MFNLRRYFSIASLLAFSVAITTLGYLNRSSAIKSLIESGEAQNTALTKLLANSFWSDYQAFLTTTPTLSDETLRNAPEIQKIYQHISQQTQGLPVAKVKIFDHRGRTVFSTDFSQIGNDKSDSEGFNSAISGTPKSYLNHRDTFDAIHGNLQNREFLSSYIPIEADSTTGQVAGVFEVYTDITPLVQQVDRTQRHILVSVVTVAGALYSILFLFICRADRILKRQHQALSDTQAALTQANGTLEDRVRDRTAQLQSTLSELQQTQEQLIQTEKMSVLGQLVAGIAHEVNTPLGAIRSSVNSINRFLTQSLHQLPALTRSLSPQVEQNFFALIDQALASQALLSAREARHQRRQLTKTLEGKGIHNETFADTLVDMGIYDNIDAALVILQQEQAPQLLDAAYKLSGIQRGIRTIETAAGKAAKVVIALKNYAHSEHSGEKVQTDLVDCLETILTLYRNQLKQGIEIVRDYQQPIPSIPCYTDELSQVWSNLIHNALQAMQHQGTLTLAIKLVDTQIIVSISDTGPGLPAELKDKIFEPFFTTKPLGEGTGLGLSIVKRIVDKHNGHIQLETIPGKTTFSVILPMGDGPPQPRAIPEKSSAVAPMVMS